MPSVRLSKPSGPSTVFILGAGFSRCAGLPVQAAFSSLLLSPDFAGELDMAITGAIGSFLKEVFGWRPGTSLPTVEDIFTCIDLSSGTGHNLGLKYPPKFLRALRRMLIYRIFSVLDRHFLPSEDIYKLLRLTCGLEAPSPQCGFVVLNWDIVLERHLRDLRPDIVIDYCCPTFDWNAPSRPMAAGGVPICKMHGSSNWVYCDNCRSLFFDVSQKLSLATRTGLVKADFRLFSERFTDKVFDLALGLEPHSRNCKHCGYSLSTHIATFSYVKSFRTPAYPSIWYHAEKLLAGADHWVFIGYSLPEADYELKHLLKVAELERMSNRPGAPTKKIDVVVKDDEKAIDKFRALFGSDKVTAYNDGLSGYVSHL